MFKLNSNFLQKYARDAIKPIPIMDHHIKHYYYEVTVTFTPAYWSKIDSLESIPQVIADILKPIIKTIGLNKTQIAYAVEYHTNGYPHLHAQILTGMSIHPEDQRSIHQRLCRRYGKSQWYQTGEEDYLHINDKYPEGILWSQYIQKDKLQNEENGQQHYFQYQIGF